MIKDTAWIGCVYKCSLCRRSIREKEQYVKDSFRHDGSTIQRIFHVRCIMDVCGEWNGVEWRSPEEIALDEFWEDARAKVARGESMIDA